MTAWTRQLLHIVLTSLVALTGERTGEEGGGGGRGGGAVEKKAALCSTVITTLTILSDI